MRRFKLVKISKRRVEVQKVRFGINIGTLAVALLFAVLVWLYVAGSQTPATTPGETTEAPEVVTEQVTSAEETTPMVETEGSHE